MSSLALMNIHYNHEVNLDRAVEISLTLNPRNIDFSSLVHVHVTHPVFHAFL